MRIVDTFLFSEPHEKEVLLIKLNLGAHYVAEWVLVENEYTHQSEFKGLFAQQMIDGDPRFDPFKDRLRIISGTHPFPPVDRTQDVDEQGLAADRAQRRTDQTGAARIMPQAPGVHFFIRRPVQAPSHI